MPTDSRNHDRSPTSQHYTMKTSTRPTLASSHSHHAHNSRHSQSNLQSLRANRTSTTPMASPRLPHSVGQPYPPSAKITSPGVAIADVRSPSPNYFGLNIEPHGDLRESAQAPLDNWSSHNSSVKSFGAAMPKQLPLDANPEFEAFRRQIDANRTNPFNLGNSHFAPPPALRPVPPHRSTNQSDAASEISFSRLGNTYVSSDSKRNSEASLNNPSFTSIPRFESPAQSESPFEPIRRTTLSKVDDRHPRLSLPHNNADSSVGHSKLRSETLPANLSSGDPGLMLTDQLKNLIQDSPQSEYLLLDVRVATHYSQSRIRGALNLCIPTTLLKRAAFDLDKLQKTLQLQEDQDKFSQWQNAKTLVIYDASSSEKRDAVSAMNMLKKFSNAGFAGKSYLLKGGFHAFAAAFPKFVDHKSAAERGGRPASTSESGRPSFAPVIGGVSLPSGANDPNPFFGNIRQNMDLADGVGQMDVSLPTNVDLDTVPKWLHEAVKPSDHGKMVSERFLNIERKEQSRMREAYSSFNAPKPPAANSGQVQLSGVEKGVKNRYKDILPFEHARVHLPGRSGGACDYINASHIQASRSHKRYIASQGPLPATFDDFWLVVWDQDVRVLVMLTAEQEGGQLKCHPYWRERDFGPIKLKSLSEKKVSLDMDKHRSGSANAPSSNSSAEASRRRAHTTTTLGSSGPAPPSAPPSEEPYVVIRKFALSHTAYPFAPVREITHLHYPSWPDFGTPAQPSHLLALVEIANVMQRSALPVDARAIAASAAQDHPATMNFDEPESDSYSRPMLVHCSAGCGRTGTFCTVDSVIDMLKRQRVASVSGGKEVDAEGDIDMSDGPISPRSGKKPRHHASQSDMRGIEPSWVGGNGLDLIESTVEDFRKQRLSMVQSLRQYVLCYESVVEWVWRLQERSGPSAPGRLRSGSLGERR
ncbi:hypothetical protein F5Y15DRAFT_348383 [Xylariaceae sp. FL0016]|nr:hypothetical protein F5Y15DRAFT_348383 [Xylariaceae sp. FL0016]